MSIKETFEFDVRGVAGLTKAANEAERLAAAIGKASKRTSADRIAESQAKSAGKVAEINAKRALAAEQAQGRAMLVRTQAQSRAEQARARAEVARAQAMGRIETARARAKGQADLLSMRMKEREATLERASARSAERRAAQVKRPTAAAVTTRGPDTADSIWTGVKQGIGISVADLAISAARMAATTAYRFGEAVVDAQSFRESITLAMSKYTGGAKEGQAWFDRALQMSIDLKTNSFETIDAMSRLKAAGFGDESVEGLTKAFADIKRLSPDADLKSIAIRMAQIRATGKLQGDELNEMANAWPAARDVIFKQMMKDTGKTMSELQTMQRAGKITPDMVEKALLGGVSALTKLPLGEFAKQNADTISGLFDQIKAIPSQVLLGFDASEDMGRVKGVMKDVVDFFSATSSSGKEVRTVMKDTFGAIVEGLFGVDVNKAGGTKETLQALLDVVKGSKGDIKEFASGVAAIGKGFAWVAGVAADFSSAKQAIVDFFGYKPPGGIFGAILLAPIALALNGIKALWPEMYNAGANLMNALATGIASTAGSVWQAAKNAAWNAISSVKGVLGIRSPSRVFIGIGSETAKGMAIGMSRGATETERAASDMAMRAIGGVAGPQGPANANNIPFSSSSPVAPTAGASISIGQVVVSVSGAKSDAEAASQGAAAGAAFIDQLRRDLPVVLREVAA